MPNDGVAFGADNTETNFAWGVYGGLAYDVTPSVTLDLSYRYTDLGDARSGIRTAFDNCHHRQGVADRGHHLQRRDARRALGSGLPASADAGRL